ncbi:aldehyde dehydrogenase family protein [Photobacterium minamisatsumaniensis]|uniref:aldehyde dehydrogenase family protein n=1 Tax=Photobacterium minamisatsumaniensis TaxID=2910233 RepID=UPI003D0D3160
MTRPAHLSIQDTAIIQHTNVIQKTISPVDGSVVTSVTLANLEDIDRALDLSNLAQIAWRETPLPQRKAICHKAIDALLSHRDMIASELSWMIGRPIQYAASELNGVEERARHMIEISDHALAPIILPKKKNFTRRITREPLGSVLIIAPWNYPYLTAINSIIPALLAGNSVILKHSSQTPLCAERLYQAFKEAGLPKGTFQFLHLNHKNTERLIASERIQHVVFTGSVHGGTAIEQAAAGHFHSIGLELGGKDPAYVCADADLDVAVETLVDGALFNSGQSCCGIERVYVDAAIHDDFVAKAITIINRYRLGSPLELDTTIGPMVRASAADFVRQQIREATELGAQAHIVESNFPLSREGTPYLAPQLLTNVNHQMRIMTEETFGPVLPIQKVHSDDEAIRLMNNSEYGLTACVFTTDIKKAVKLGEQIETGTFFVNRCDYLDPALAWTGVKHSGKGYSLSQLGFETLTRPKSFHIKHC